MCVCFLFVFFFFQAEDGIRDGTVTGVQTCALPISQEGARVRPGFVLPDPQDPRHASAATGQGHGVADAARLQREFVPVEGDDQSDSELDLAGSEEQLGYGVLIAVAWRLRYARPFIRYITSRTAEAALTPNLINVGASLVDSSPSIVPASASMHTTAPSMRAAIMPSITSASRRVRSPGAMSPCASRNAAPPEMKMAVSSSTPWPAMNVVRYKVAW